MVATITMAMIRMTPTTIPAMVPPELSSSFDLLLSPVCVISIRTVKLNGSLYTYTYVHYYACVTYATHTHTYVYTVHLELQNGCQWIQLYSIVSSQYSGCMHTQDLKYSNTEVSTQQ